MEYGHNLAKDGTSSVKIHHQPGGASTFSLGHGAEEDDDRWGNKAKAAANAQKPAEEEKKDEMPTAAGNKPLTSVKYSGNPPGGKSNFTLG